MNLHEWVIKNGPFVDQQLGKEQRKQIIFIGDKIAMLFFDERMNYFDLIRRVNVISTFIFKTITLPIYHLNFKDIFGIEFILSNNLHKWKVSVNSNFPVIVDFFGLIDIKKNLVRKTCEDFPDWAIYQPYDENNSLFTFECKDNYDLYTVMYILRNYLLNTGRFIPNK